MQAHILLIPVLGKPRQTDPQSTQINELQLQFGGIVSKVDLKEVGGRQATLTSGLHIHIHAHVHNK